MVSLVFKMRLTQSRFQHAGLNILAGYLSRSLFVKMNVRNAIKKFY